MILFKFLSLISLVGMATASPPSIDKSPNPKVVPGLVKWHPTFSAACDAAKKSRKPVLLFQMLGKLDDQFC